MIDFKEVGLKIAKYRKEQDLTQDDLAEYLYVSRQLVSKWENGTGIPSIDVLLELSKLFHTTFEDLLCLNEDSQTITDDIFKGQNRLYVIQNIIRKELDVNLPNIFYRFSPIERMMILKAIKSGELSIDLMELCPKLTPGEQKYLDQEKANDFKKNNDWRKRSFWTY